MFIRVANVEENPILRYLLQILIRVHGFRWKSRYGYMLCENIYRVSIRGKRITIHHTADNNVFKTCAIWTRIEVPVDPEGTPIIVHVHSQSWPPTQYS